MRARAVALLTTLFAVMLVGQCPALAGEPGVREADSAEVRLSDADRTPMMVLWKTADEPTASQEVRKSTESLTVEAGEGCLVAVRKGFAPVAMRLTLDPGGVHSLEPMTWAPGVTVTGQVAASTGAGVVGRLVMENTKRGEEAEDDPCTVALREGGVTAGLTDEGGGFALGPVAPGTYALGVTAENHEAVERKLVLGPKPRTQDIGTVVLEAIAELDLSFDLSEIEESPPFTVSLRRHAEGYFGLQSNEWSEVRSVAAQDDAPLRMSLDPGFYRFVFVKEGTEIWFVEEHRLFPGYNIVTLRPRPITVRGKVLRGESVVEDADVLFICSGAETSVTSSEEGEYEARLWAATTCGVRARAPDGGAYATSVDLKEANYGDEVELDLEIPEHVVKGTVVDASTTEPIAGARVSLRQVKSDWSGASSVGSSTDEAGRFEFVSASAGSAETTLRADADGYLPTRDEIQVVSTGPTVVRLELKEATGIRGRVVGPGGEPVAGARVGCCAVDPTQPFLVSATTDGGGEFQLDAAPATVVFAAGVGYTVGWAPALDPDQQTVIRLGPRAHRVLFRLIDSEGQPVSGSYLYYATSSAGVVGRGVLGIDAVMNGQSSRTDANGQLSTTSLPPGLYQVLVVSREGLVSVGQVMLPFYGEATLHLPSQDSEP